MWWPHDRFHNRWARKWGDLRERRCVHASRRPPICCWLWPPLSWHPYRHNRSRPIELPPGWAGCGCRDKWYLKEWHGKGLSYRVFSTPPVFAWLRTCVKALGFNILCIFKEGKYKKQQNYAFTNTAFWMATNSADKVCALRCEWQWQM